MKKCLVCGFENPDGTKFCGSCGSSITTGEKRCPKCGKFNPSDSKFCLECGSSLTIGSLLQASKESDTLVIGAMETGGTIGGRYRITKKLGQGGFGATYLVEHTGLGEQMVLKELLRKSNKAWELFKREATTLRKLDVKGVPKVVDYFEEQGKLYLVEDYIEGKTLREVLQMKKKLTEKESRWLLLELLKIVGDLHKQGVIHRDIKPDNIIISHKSDAARDFSSSFSQDVKVYLIDFGSVKEASQEVIAGKTGTAVFSHGYAAPEQLQGKIGYESDIYAVGMIIAEVLTGKYPTDLREEIEDIRLRITDSRLAEVVQKMTLFERKKRYKSVKDVVKDITNLGEYTYNRQGLLNKSVNGVIKDISEVNGEARDILPKVDIDKEVLIASKKEEEAEIEVEEPEKKKEMRFKKNLVISNILKKIAVPVLWFFGILSGLILVYSSTNVIILARDFINPTLFLIYLFLICAGIGIILYKTYITKNFVILKNILLALLSLFTVILFILIIIEIIKEDGSIILFIFPMISFLFIPLLVLKIKKYLVVLFSIIILIIELLLLLKFIKDIGLTTGALELLSGFFLLALPFIISFFYIIKLKKLKFIKSMTFPVFILIGLFLFYLFADNFITRVRMINFGIKEKEGMVLIPGGWFEMGDHHNTGDSDEKPVHRVYISSFWMSKYEITNKEFSRFLNYKGNRWEGGVRWLSINNSKIVKKGNSYYPERGYEKHPVVYVTWYGARAYAKWKGGRLPTEAEWEYAARGGLKGKKYPWGNNSPFLKANFQFIFAIISSLVNELFFPLEKTGSYFSNKFGLYDMSGNVWEWCNDWYDKNYYSSSPSNNPKGPYSGEYKVLRGGSWSSWDIRSAVRYRLNPDYGNDLYGFRLVVPSE